MAIKDLMKATKADRYTADGRNELNEALKADVEDRTYKTGEISEKTGLQKQPDGSWAPPKSGAKAGKQSKPAAKPTTEELNTLKDIMREYRKNPNKQTEQIMNEAKSHLMKNRGMTPEQLGKIGREVMAETSKPAAEKPTDKYKDLPGAQKKDALYASTFEGSSIGMTQTSMERNGWDLIQADDDVNVYAKPDGSKVTMKHDGQKITSSEYEAPGSKTAAPSTSEIATSLDEITNPNGGTKNIGGVKVTYVPGNGYRVTHKAPSGTELTTGYDSIEEAQQAVMFRLNRIKKGEIPAISEDAAPRILTGDTKIRVRR